MAITQNKTDFGGHFAQQRRQIIPKGGIGKEDENKETMKNLRGRSSDYGDGLMMRMCFEVQKQPEPGIRWL
jgi:hypothetical protein